MTKIGGWYGGKSSFNGFAVLNDAIKYKNMFSFKSPKMLK